MKTGVIVTLVLLITISPLHVARASDLDDKVMAFVWQRWRGLVEENCKDFDPAMVLGIIAQESRGEANALRLERNGNYSVGLMQIHAFSWRPPVSYLRDPENNIAYGCNILRQIFANLETKNGKVDVAKALAIYNCGEVKVEAGRCGSFGGYYYAEQIIDKWWPLAQRQYNIYYYNIYCNRRFIDYIRMRLNTGVQEY